MPEKGGAGIMRYLTFALTKGRLASKTLDMFDVSGRGKQPLSRWSARNRNFVAKNCSKVSSTRYPSRYIVVRWYEQGRG